MHRHIRISLSAFGTAALFSATACEAAPGPRTEATGSLSFSHDAGQFSASGAYSSKSTNETKRTTTWAMGFIHGPTNTTAIEAHLARPDNLSDQILLVLDRTATGNVTITSDCVTSVVHVCASIDVLFATTGDFFNDPGATTCGIDSGTATIASLTDDRIIGSFSGDGTCRAPGGGISAFHIQNGTFDVGRVTEP